MRIFVYVCIGLWMGMLPIKLLAYGDDSDGEDIYKNWDPIEGDQEDENEDGEDHTFMSLPSMSNRGSLNQPFHEGLDVQANFTSRSFSGLSSSLPIEIPQNSIDLTNEKSFLGPTTIGLVKSGEDFISGSPDDRSKKKKIIQVLHSQLNQLKNQEKKLLRKHKSKNLSSFPINKYIPGLGQSQQPYGATDSVNNNNNRDYKPLVNIRPFCQESSCLSFGQRNKSSSHQESYFKKNQEDDDDIFQFDS